MKINLNPTYISDSSSARRQPIPIDINLDPSANSITAPFKQARQNGYISPIGLNKNLSAMLVGIQSASFSNPYTGGGAEGGAGGTGGNLEPVIGTAPLQVANLQASYVGGDIVLTFDFDVSDPRNQFFFNFNVGLSLDGGTTFTIITPSYEASSLSTSSINQTVTVKASASGLANSVSFNYVEVATYDTFLQTAGYVKSAISNTYTCLLPAPIITEADSVSSYTITTTNIDAAKATVGGNFLAEIIQEFTYATTGLNSTQVDAAVAAALAANQSGWVTVGEPKTISPSSIFAASGGHRYVRAWFMDTLGAKSAYSNYVEATPTDLLPNNTLPPSGVTSASAAFNGNNITVSYTLPSISPTDPNALISLKVKLVPTDQPTQAGFFYHTVVSGETSFTIPQNLIFAQFGNYFSSYSGSVYGVSQYGTESTSVASLSTFTRANPLSGVVPVASISNVIDGYTVNFNFSGTAATNAEVYQFLVDPTPLKNLNIDIQDYLDATFSSGGASGQNTLILNNWLGDNGATYNIPNEYIGGIITGNGIPSNTYVQSLSGSGTSRTITLSKNLTSQASGNYHIQNLVYKGTTAANIFLNLYQTVYVLVVFYDDYDNNSSPSINYLATPTNPATSVIANAVQIGSGGSIYVGASSTTGSRIVLGPSGNKGPDGSTAYSGIFAFDYGSNSGSAASTSIITNPSAASYTFETTNAKIADWSINSTQIQNTLSNGATNYVGLSATGTYSFWAGSAVSGGDLSAKFSVTPQGKVSARDIVIYGSGNNSDTLLSAGAYFTVKGDGTVNASNATISGHLNVSQSSTFSSDITLNSNAYLLALGTTSTGTASTIDTGSSVQIGSAGIKSYNKAHLLTTQISSSEISDDKVSLATIAAYLGGMQASDKPWVVKSGKIYSNQIELNSSDGTITVFPNDYSATQNNFGVKLYGGTSTSSDYAISVGALSGIPKFFVTHVGDMTASNATITGNITATTGKIGSGTNYWTIDSAVIKSVATTTGASSYILLDSANNAVVSYANDTTALGSNVTYYSVSTGGSIPATAATANGEATTVTYGAGYLKSDKYMIITTKKAFQVFGTSQAKGSVPAFFVDPDGTSTTWNADGTPTSTTGFTAISTSITYIDSASTIIGRGSSSNLYLNGLTRTRNDTPVLGSTGSYVRNVYVHAGAPSAGSNDGFVGDLWVSTV